MVKFVVEVCIISARGLGRWSSFWKPQWFAVGWIDPNNKYCTKIDTSGSANPTWKTKFSALIDDSEPNMKDAALHVQVYHREPIFLGEKLQGTAIIMLKEFLAKSTTSAGEMGGGQVEEVGSFQLRKKKNNNSGKPQGFVDISIRISKQRNGDNAHSFSGVYAGEDEGLFNVNDDGSSSVSAPYPSMPRAPTPPPPPPPSHVGYLPTFLPTSHHQFTPPPPPPPPPYSSYVNLPPMSSSAPPHIGSGFRMGVGAGALAAGAVIFGDDFMSGFDLPSALQAPDAAVTISTDPLF